MSWSGGTNTIKEGDESKSLTLQMLEVKKQGGGTEYFVRKNDVKLGTKSVTQNGTYTAAADDKTGFSQFKVNVKGGNGSANSSGKPTYTPPSGSTPASGVEAGGSGSAVVGTDPETGNDVVVGVDSTGTLVTTPIPTSIVLVTNPTKMDYNDGESIDLSGAVVVAKMADGTTWTDADHPNGHVSCSCDPAAADASQVTDVEKTYDFTGIYEQLNDELPFVYAPANYEVDVTGGYTGHLVVESNADCAVGYAGFVDLISRSPISGTGYLYRKGLLVTTFNYSSSYPSQTLNGTTFYSAVANSGAKYDETQFPMNRPGTNNVTPYATAYYDGIAVPGTGGQTITLNWARPGDGKVLSTTMEITVGAHTTESSSGTSGSGGGGTF